MKKIFRSRIRPSDLFALSAAYGMVSIAMAQVGTPTVTSDATTVYYKIPYSGSPSFVRVFVDNDHQASTGYPAYGIGSRYLIENGNLYRYAGSNGSWAWTWIKQVPYALSGGAATISVARSDLSPSAIIDSVAQVESPTYTAAKVTTTLYVASTNATSQVSYTAATGAIANPERGFYNQVGCSNGVMNQAQLTNSRTSSNQSLVLCLFLMSEAINAPLTQSKLNLLQQQFDATRAAGVKMVLRFAYNDIGNATDAPLTRMLRHMDQLKPILTRNSDVLAVVQAGFIGSWGEWADSLNYGAGATTTAQQWTDRKTILNKLLDMVPAERMVQLRMPDFAYKLVGTTALTASEAFNGSAKARLGQHNDCFLATNDDWGTYYNLPVDYPWLAAQTTYTPMGGESCIVNQPRSDCPTAMSEMSRFHWSYIHNGYNETVLNNWRVQDCYETINQKLGYRFVLKDGNFSNSAKPGGGFAVNLNLVNDGYAAPFNTRPVQLVLRNNASGRVYRIALSADPRKWLPGQPININQTVTLPSTMESGNYSVMLNLPDAASSISNRPEYAIQLANSSTWEASTGFNKLNHTASIAP
jgi:hypothetical protein